MADFNSFWPVLLKAEGYYANKKNDSGGETWMGIARNYWPSWEGWKIVDSYKSSPDFPKIMRQDGNLLKMVQAFYRVHFWAAIAGDQINNQSIVNMIGDWGVNAGEKVPIKHAQAILGLATDGVAGPKTVAAINSADQETFFNHLKQDRIQFYYAVVAKHPEDKQFLGDWISRTNAITFSA